MATTTTNPEKLTVKILGAVYSIEYRSAEEDTLLKDKAGYTDWTIKKIVIGKKDPDCTLGKFSRAQAKVLRHEIIHAFLLESGLDINSLVSDEGWATNEEMIDFFAFQGEKIAQVWKDANVLTFER